MSDRSRNLEQKNDTKREGDRSPSPSGNSSEQRRWYYTRNLHPVKSPDQRLRTELKNLWPKSLKLHKDVIEHYEIILDEIEINGLDDTFSERVKDTMKTLELLERDPKITRNKSLTADQMEKMSGENIDRQLQETKEITDMLRGLANQQRMFKNDLEREITRREEVENQQQHTYANPLRNRMF